MSQPHSSKDKAEQDGRNLAHKCTLDYIGTSITFSNQLESVGWFARLFGRELRGMSILTWLAAAQTQSDDTITSGGTD